MDSYDLLAICPGTDKVFQVAVTWFFVVVTGYYCEKLFLCFDSASLQYSQCRHNFSEAGWTSSFQTEISASWPGMYFILLFCGWDKINGVLWNISLKNHNQKTITTWFCGPHCYCDNEIIKMLYFTFWELPRGVWIIESALYIMYASFLMYLWPIFFGISRHIIIP